MVLRSFKGFTGSPELTWSCLISSTYEIDLKPKRENNMPHEYHIKFTFAQSRSITQSTQDTCHQRTNKVNNQRARYRISAVITLD